MKENITNIIDSQDSIFTALSKMDKEGVKSLLVFSGNIFEALLTIGDIQRAIIRNVDLKLPVCEILDKNKVYANPTDNIQTIKNKVYRLRAECMPIVNDQGELVDIYYWKDLFDVNQTHAREKINLPVIIMAGGKGTRLKPITNIIPKPLIPLGEKTILELILDQFEEIGCSRFFMSVNYKFDILKYYLDNLEKKYNINFFKEEKPLGTIGSVSLLKNILTEPFFVSNCDIIIDQDFRDVYEYHKNNKNLITLVTAVKSYSIPYGVIETGEGGILSSMSEKPNITYMINTGVYLLEPSLIEEIPYNTFFHITDLIEKVRNKGGQIGCFPVSEKSWKDIGDWKEYFKYIAK
ncbi:nucleotidyltransferase family protein [Proteiniphilum sp. X52]|uniref:nucleotidyltransferase family protein n=1 Tax=Proteiniphilum sp. X52 TaxID=2382159 RepID=UPI001C874172|nr:nucleotidyltransferase family protein [Proteiniphilum sp. X52]